MTSQPAHNPRAFPSSDKINQSFTKTYSPPNLTCHVQEKELLLTNAIRTAGRGLITRCGGTTEASGELRSTRLDLRVSGLGT
jgi:hypothetical protein